MTKPGLLLFAPIIDQLLGDALVDRFDRIRLWETQDPDALIDSRGRDVIATLAVQIDARMIERLPNLRLIASPGAGYDGIDVAAARARGITVATAGHTHSGDVADHTVALILASLHGLLQLQTWVRDGSWQRGDSRPRRHAMSGQRFGIVGLGNIGTAIAERLVPFGGQIAWWGHRTKTTPWPRHESLLDLARWCTTLIVAVQGNAIGLIDAKTIDAVGPEGRIVNVSRGAVIDENALIEALKAGRLGQAALDVFLVEPAPPARWHDVPNVILTPHIAGESYESIARLRDAAVRNLMSAIDGGPVINEIR